MRLAPSRGLSREAIPANEIDYEELPPDEILRNPSNSPLVPIVIGMVLSIKPWIRIKTLTPGLITLIVQLAFLPCMTAAEPDARPPYKQPRLPIEERVEDLLGRMTLSEKVAQMVGFWRDNRLSLQDINEKFLSANFAEGIGQIGPHQMSISDEAEFRNAIQKYLLTKTRLGIPAIFHDEGCHGLMKPEATSFPAPIGLACSWDTALIERVYGIVAEQMRSRGAQLALTPILDVVRDPRFGRVEEMYGEDPFLNGRLGAATVLGLQGGSTGLIDHTHVLATLKHFAGHGSPEGGLNRAPFQGGLRELLEVQMAPFSYVISTANPAAVMPSYNEIDGIPSHANQWLLQDILRGELGFRGLIVSDYGGIERLCKVQHVAKDEQEAARQAIEAGVQIELPTPYGFSSLTAMVQNGAIEQRLVDHAVRNLLSVKFKLGLFEDPFVDASKAQEIAAREESRLAARDAARRSIVLLKNDEGILPLDANRYNKIAVIGPNADIARLGGYSGTPLTPPVSILAGLENRLRSQVDILHAKGCVVVNQDHRNAFANWKMEAKDLKIVSDADNRELIVEAADLAANSDLIILVLGDSELTCREAWSPDHLGDRDSLDLLGSQTALAEAVLASGKPVVLYLMNGRPVSLGNLRHRFNAIIEGWYMGEETGTAAAEIIMGDVSPSGKLTISFPDSAGSVPVYYSKKNGAGEFAYLFGQKDAIYPFGFGLSYTTFSYSKPLLKKSIITVTESTDVSIEVQNTGSIAADEIVQMYIRDEVASITRPVKELRGFSRIHLKPGEKSIVTFPIDSSALSFYDKNFKRRVEPGTFQILVGTSSIELQSATLIVH